MSYPSAFDISRGLAHGTRSLHVFGRNTSVGTAFAPIALGGNYRTPQVGAATALRVKAGGNVGDTAAGAGAREITFVGLDATGALIEDTVATAGASASSATSKQFLRLHKAYVSKSGTYATQVAGSNVGTIVIEDAAGTQDWAQIKDVDFSRGQSQIAVYSVPKNRSAIITGMTISCDADKKVNLLLFSRSGILETSAPYQPMLLQEEFPQIGGVNAIPSDIPLGPFPELTDIGFMARSTSTTVDVAVHFNIVESLP